MLSLVEHEKKIISSGPNLFCYVYLSVCFPAVLAYSHVCLKVCMPVHLNFSFAVS